MDNGSLVMDVHSIIHSHCKLINSSKDLGKVSRLLHRLKYNLVSNLRCTIEFGRSCNLSHSNRSRMSKFVNNSMVFGSLTMDVHSTNEKIESWFKFLNELELSNIVIASLVQCLTISLLSALNCPIPIACHSIVRSIYRSMRLVMSPIVEGNLAIDEHECMNSNCSPNSAVMVSGRASKLRHPRSRSCCSAESCPIELGRFCNFSHPSKFKTWSRDKRPVEFGSTVIDVHLLRSSLRRFGQA